MKIIHVLSDIAPSGAERMLESSMEPEKTSNCNQMIFAFGKDKGFGKKLVDQGFLLRTGNSNAKSLIGLKHYVISLREFKPNVVHVHVEQNFLLIFLIARVVLKGAVLVRTVHGYHKYPGRLRIRRRVWMFLAIKFLKAKWVCVSKRISTNEASYYKTHLHVIDNWASQEMKVVDMNLACRKSEGDNKRILLIGNCDDNKNHVEILNRYVNSESVKIMHLGSTENASKEELNLLEGKNVEVLVGNPKDAILMADELALPSLVEASPIVVIESLLMNRPINVRRSWGLTYSEWCELSQSELGPEFIKLLKPIDYSKFASHFSPKRGRSEYLKLYGRK